jgi:hypothetical protein
MVREVTSFNDVVQAMIELEQSDSSLVDRIEQHCLGRIEKVVSELKSEFEDIFAQHGT